MSSDGVAMRNKEKKLTFFFCDINGTINGENSENDYKEFSELLEKLGHKNKSDGVVFAFASTESPETIMKYKERVSRYFDGYVQYASLPEGLDSADSKIKFKMACLRQYSDSYEIGDVYYADDTIFFHDLFAEILEDVYGVELHSIIPGQGENQISFISEEIRKQFLGSLSLK